MANNLPKQSEKFRSDTHQRLLSEGSFQIAAAVQLSKFINSKDFSDDAYYGGMLQGSGDDKAEIYFSPWGEGYVGIEPMRVWHVHHRGIIYVVALCPEKQPPNPEFPKYPELGTVASRAKSVLEKDGVAGASNWYLVAG